MVFSKRVRDASPRSMNLAEKIMTGGVVLGTALSIGEVAYSVIDCANEFSEVYECYKNVGLDLSNFGHTMYHLGVASTVGLFSVRGGRIYERLNRDNSSNE